MSRTITVEHLCRVEGHGGVIVELENGAVKNVRMDIYEGLRFFESFLKRVRWADIPEVACRICAICSGVHNIVASQAIEDAFGVVVSEQTRLLRRLFVHGGNIESHALHIFLLALPDLVRPRYNSVIELAQELPDAARIGLDIKKCGNEIQDLVGGREIHPCNTKIGGFGRIPDKDVFKHLRNRLEASLENAKALIPLIKDLELPAYLTGKGTFIGLKPEGGAYGYMGDHIAASDGALYDVHEYRRVTNEYVVPYSHAKFSAYNGEPYVVGALARLNLFGDLLHREARTIARRLGFAPPVASIFHNTVAQFIELVDSIEDSLEAIEHILADYEPDEPTPEVRPKAGWGAAGIEAPRGTLYHAYGFDHDGRCTEADIITPTCQNLAAMERDIRAMVEANPGFSDEEIHFHAEIIVRAYDPCISCS
ncbi:MAG TPA: Ni/Fe hydrogenase subunit alpha, partial [Candidatus Coatesbacteria bacterium]|nr:Ni/Fe hydrogenase subunit alpha [Candidatus Coatesbacteria bacterium]